MSFISKQSKKFYLILFLISFAACVLRIQVCRELYANDVFSNNPPEHFDMRSFLRKSEALFDGTYVGPMRSLPFYYALFLPSVYCFLGKGIWGILVIQSIIGGLTVWLTGISGALVRNRKTGILAALFTCFAFMPILYTAYVLIATLQTFFLSLFLYVSLLALRKRALMYWALLGVVCACMILTRGNTLMLIPLVAFFSLNNWGRRELKRGALHSFLPCLVLILSIAIPIVLFTAYNSIAAGVMVPPSTGGFRILALGWNPETPSGELVFYPTLQYWYGEADSHSLFIRIVDWFFREPFVVVELFVRKFLLFWDSQEVFNNITDFSRCKQLSFCMRNFHFLPTSFFLAGFISCFFLNVRVLLRRKRMFFVFLVCFFYSLSVVAFIILTRYRVPIIPLLAIFTAVFYEIASKRKGGFRSYPFKFTGTLLVGFCWVFFSFSFYRYFLEKHIHRVVHPSGIIVPLGKQTLYLDNGPLEFGSHMRLCFVKGMVMNKSFAFRKCDIGKKALLQIPIKCVLGKKMIVKINGTLHYLTTRKMHEKKMRTEFRRPDWSNATLGFHVIVPADGIFKIEPMVINDDNSSVFVDTQRDFGRTFVNGVKVDGELVCRVIVDSNE